MKSILLFIILIVGAVYSNAQTSQPNPVRHFAQAMMQNLQPQDANLMVADLQSNPNVLMVRYDELTNGLLVVTNEMSSFDQSVFNSWLTIYASNVVCYRDGIQGIDTHLAFNPDFCNNL